MKYDIINLKDFFWKKRLFALPAISGIFLGSALTTPPFFLGFFGLTPLFYFLLKVPSMRKALWGSWIFGFVYWLFLVQWILKFLPLDWAGFGTISAAFFIIFSWIVTAAGMGLAYLIFGFIVKRFFASRQFLLVFPGVLVWLTMEYISSSFLTILWMGEKTRIYPITLGHIGYVAENTSLLGLAAVGSLYFLSAAVFFANMVFLGMVLRQRAVWIMSALPVFILFLFLLYPSQKQALDEIGKASIRVALVSSNIPSWAEMKTEDKKKVSSQLKQLLENLSEEQVDLIVFPESARVGNNVNFDELKNLFTRSGTLLVDNVLERSTESGEDPLRSRLIVRNLKTSEVAASWDKSHLFMAGEYAPLLLSGMARMLGLSDVLVRYEKNSYEPGKDDEKLIMVHDRFGAISLCTQGWAPQYFARMKEEGADFLINMSSDALFHGSRSYPRERLAMLKVRAVENKSYVLHAGNANPSVVIDPQGNVVAEISTKEPFGYVYTIFTLP